MLTDCIYCHGEHSQMCPACSLRASTTFSHWPLELACSARALEAVEKALRTAVALGDTGKATDEVLNIANAIRSHMQHKVERALRANNDVTDSLLD